MPADEAEAAKQNLAQALRDAREAARETRDVPVPEGEDCVLGAPTDSVRASEDTSNKVSTRADDGLPKKDQRSPLVPL